MKNILKVDPVITFDHMHSEEKDSSAMEHKTNHQIILFVLEIVTVFALLGFMILLMN